MIKIIQSLFFTFSLLFTVTSFAQDSHTIVESAKMAYDSSNYEAAIGQYQQLLFSHPYSAELHYNLANAYYKNNEIPYAILHYEKALKIEPNHADANHNLDLAMAKTVDKIEGIPELFLYRWWRAIFNLFSAETWAQTCLLFVYMALCFGLIYLFSKQVVLKKIGFYSGITFLVLSLLSWVLAAKQQAYLDQSSHAIIIEPTININSSPSAGSSKLFVLHEGTKVKIEDQSVDWFEISIPNGNKGWVQVDMLAEI